MKSFCMEITCFDQIEASIHFIFLFGIIFWSLILYILSRGFFISSTEGAEPRSFSTFQLQLPFSFAKYKKLVERIDEKSKKPLLWSIWIDFIFMIFAYPFLALVAWHLQENLILEECWASKYDQVTIILQCCIVIPFIGWLLDIIENIIMLSSLKTVTFIKSKILLLVAISKWCCVFFTIVCLLFCFFL